jgi:hypothetical protein
MHQPIRQPAAGLHCPEQPAVPPRRGSYLRALLRLFADLACRLR